MAAKNPAQLAGLLNLSSMDKGGPLGAACALGAIDGYPVAVAWNRRAKPGAVGVRHDGTQGRPTVTFLVRFKKGTLSVPPAEFGGKIATSSRLLGAMERTPSAGSGKNAVTVAPDAVFFYWDYTLRAPKPEAAAGVLRALVDIVKASAAPVGDDCEVCGSTRTGELGTINRALVSVCAGCRERMGEEDRRAIEAYESRASNPLLGTAAGLGAAAGGALLWGGVAYSLHRIFLYGGILIGIGIAWAVNKGMGKVNLYGRVLSVALTIASVLAGDFFFMWLSAADELKEPATLDLAQRLLPHFFAIEFADSSGYLSVLFGVLGAVYILFVNRPPVAKRVFVPLAGAR